MWPSIRRFRDWAIPEMGLATRNDAIHIRAELAGLVLDNQPIPWNAEAVVIEVDLKLPTTVRRKDEFLLQMTDRPPIRAESLRVETPGGRSTVTFRFAPPGVTDQLELHWRDRLLGRMELPVLQRDAFLNSLKMQLPTLHARIGDEMVACQTFLSSQCSGLTVGGLLTAPTSLAPLIELGLNIEIRGATNEVLASVAVPLSGGQLINQQALVTAHPRRIPKRSGEWKVIWKAGARELATIHARAVAPAKFRRSLQLVGTRWIVDDGAGIRLQMNYPKFEKVVRTGPCFLVNSQEPGMAARTKFEIITHKSNTSVARSLEVLITDGPSIVAPGTLEIDQLTDVQVFELKQHGRSLGTLPIHPVPAAKFDSEGGFRQPVDFAWSQAADDELGERLGKLMGS